jgi:hypothetical protein
MMFLSKMFVLFALLVVSGHAIRVKRQFVSACAGDICSHASFGDCAEDNVDYYQGGDLHDIKNIDSWQQCGQQCKEYVGCNYWTWGKPTWSYAPDRKTCYLKSSKSGRRAGIGVISGSRNCGGPKGPVEYCLRVRVVADYFQRSYISTSEYSKTIITSESFKENFDSLSTSASVSASFKLFSASAQATYDSVSSSASHQADSRHTEQSSKVEFDPDFLQIVQKVTREVTINGVTAKTITTELKDAVPQDAPLSYDELIRRENDFIRRYARASAGKGIVRENSFTENKCIKV